MTTLTDDRVVERATIIFESDVLCQCGADPRPVNAHRDPAWFIEYMNGDDDEAIVICPRCW